MSKEYYLLGLFLMCVNGMCSLMQLERDKNETAGEIVTLRKMKNDVMTALNKGKQMTRDEFSKLISSIFTR